MTGDFEGVDFSFDGRGCVLVANGVYVDGFRGGTATSLSIGGSNASDSSSDESTCDLNSSGSCALRTSGEVGLSGSGPLSSLSVILARDSGRDEEGSDGVSLLRGDPVSRAEGVDLLSEVPREAFSTGNGLLVSGVALDFGVPL